LGTHSVRATAQPRSTYLICEGAVFSLDSGGQGESRSLAGISTAPCWEGGGQPKQGDATAISGRHPVTDLRAQHSRCRAVHDWAGYGPLPARPAGRCAVLPPAVTRYPASIRRCEPAPDQRRRSSPFPHHLTGRPSGASPGLLRRRDAPQRPKPQFGSRLGEAPKPLTVEEGRTVY
jgi:hypothetical protein